MLSPKLIGAVVILGVLLALGIKAVARLCGSDRARRSSIQLAVLVSSLVAAVILGELAIRLATKDVSTTGYGKTYYTSRWERAHPPRLNALGFREREISVKAEGSFRIVVVGDSFTYGQGILDEHRFSNILERLLIESGSPLHYEVLNFGGLGLDTREQLERLDQIAPVAPDYVLLQWYVNDVDGQDVDGQDVSEPGPLLPSSTIHNLLFRESALYYVADQAWRRFQARVGWADAWDDRLAARFSDPGSRVSRAAFGSLEELIERSKELGAGVAVVLFPSLEEVRGDPSAYRLGFLLDRALDVCELHAVTCVDLRPVFAPISPASRLWASRFDAHPGPLAHEIAATAIMEQVGPEWR